MFTNIKKILLQRLLMGFFRKINVIRSKSKRFLSQIINTSIILRANIIVRPYLIYFLFLLFYIFTSSIYNITFADEYWENSWIQGAPLEKQPQWFRNSSEDQRSLYEQMNGPTWHNLADNYDLEDNNPSYKPLGWNHESPSDASNGDNSYDYSTENITEEEILREFSNCSADWTEKDLITKGFEFIEEYVHSSYFVKKDSNLLDPASSIQMYLRQFYDEERSYTIKELASLSIFHSLVLTYNEAFINNLTETKEELVVRYHIYRDNFIQFVKETQKHPMGNNSDGGNFGNSSDTDDTSTSDSDDDSNAGRTRDS